MTSAFSRGAANRPVVRATFIDTGSMSLREASDRLHNLNQLVDVAAALEKIGDLDTHTQYGRSFANAIIRSKVELPVTRLSYNSPYEIYFYIAAGTSGVAYSASRLVDLFTNFQAARIRKFQADVAKSDAALRIVKNDYLTDMLRHPLEGSATVSKSKAAQKKVAAADKALDELHGLEISETEERPAGP